MVQHLELVPQDSERITSNAEMQSAAREFKWESKLQKEITGKGGRVWGWQYRDDKGQGGKKGDGKKGASKGGKDRGELTAWNPRSLTIEHSSPSARASATRSRSSEI